MLWRSPVWEVFITKQCTSGNAGLWMAESCAAGPVISVLYWPTSFFANISFQTFALCLFYWMVKIILQTERIRLAANKDSSSNGHCQPAVLCHWKQGQGDIESNWCSARPHRFPWDVTHSSVARSLSSTTTTTWIHHRLRLTSHYH